MLKLELNDARSVEKGDKPTKNLFSTVGDSLPFNVSSATAAVLHPTSLK